jgi:hypothetical protein
MLPNGYTPVAFSVAGGLPQRASVVLGDAVFRLTLAGAVGDLPALIDADETLVLVDIRRDGQRPREQVPTDARAWLSGVPANTLAPASIRLHLMAHRGDTLLGVLPVAVGTPMRYGTTRGTGLHMEVLITELVVPAGALVRPGPFGLVLEAGIRRLDQGVRVYRPVPPSRPIVKKKPPPPPSSPTKVHHHVDLVAQMLIGEVRAPVVFYEHADLVDVAADLDLAVSGPIELEDFGLDPSPEPLL